jgi:hypothetical protein
MRIAIYIPDKGNGGESGAEMQEKVVSALCEKLGGCTTYLAYGCWKSPDGQIVREPVSLVESYSNNLNAPNVAYFLALQIKHEMSQDMVAYSLDNQLFQV